MNRVLFVNQVVAAAPAHNNEVAVFNVATGAYVQSGAGTTFASLKEISLVYMRDGELINVPVFPPTTTVATGALTASAATVTTVTPTVAEVTVGETYTFILSVAGHGDDPRYTKRVSVIPTVVTFTAMLDLAVAAANLLGDSGTVGTGEINGVKFIATRSGNTLVLTNAAGSYNDIINVSAADALVDHGAVNNVLSTVSVFTGGMTETEKAAFAVEFDSELGQRHQVTAGFNTSLDELATGYIASTTALTVLTTIKPDDDVFPREENLPQKVYIFATAATNAAAFVAWFSTGNFTIIQ